MISTLFRRKPKPKLVSSPATPRVPEGVAVWAVGDLHGRFDLLRSMTHALIDDAAYVDAERKVVVFLGDYIDRGPASRDVLRHLIALPRDAGIDWRFLKGNHEAAMLRFMDEPAFGPEWCEYGGDATLLSYGLRPPQLRHRTEAWAGIAADLEHKITGAERDFLESLELSLTIGDYFFAHAGARPGKTLDRQTERDLMWIRNSFLDSDVEFEKVVVHGHTPTPKVHIDRRRIGVDTKAYDTGVLSAIRLENADRHVMQVGAAADEDADVSRHQRQAAIS